MVEPATCPRMDAIANSVVNLDAIIVRDEVAKVRGNSYCENDVFPVEYVFELPNCYDWLRETDLDRRRDTLEVF